MLVHLSIENYALIDHLDIDFHDGFSAITGETGAGKSILVDALDLALGKRADGQFLLDPARKCIVEATFAIKPYGIEFFFADEGLDFDETTVIRREINPNGKSRAFINDTPVNLVQLRSLGDLLVDIHAQNATTSLQDPGFQLSVIDTYAGIEDQLREYRDLYLELKNSVEKLDDLTEQERNKRSTLDYKQFLLDEILKAGFLPDEQEQLEEKFTMITHAEEIKGVLYQAQAYLNEDEQSILNRLSQVGASLQRILAFHPGLGPLSERLQSDLIDLKDIGSELARINESIDFNQEQQVAVQQRLDLIYRLEQKHHVSSVNELIAISDRLKLDVSDLSTLENEIGELKKKMEMMRSELEHRAFQLTKLRKSVFPKLENEIISSLAHMGIPEARFEARLEPMTDYTPSGLDKVEFYFNANRGHSLKPLSDIASGGELSRVMLSIKSIISTRKHLPTIIFDEIDNGLSGDIAGRVGDVLLKAAARMQVIAVTHLPQIAGKARYHYSVFKLNKNNITFSNIKSLDDQERISELAKMIGGRDVTSASLEAARELLTSF